MYAKVHSLGLLGIDAYVVEVESDMILALQSFNVVGLPDAAIKESRDRVQSAIVNSGFTFPNEKVTSNLAPADIKKVGPIYDLAILISILGASKQLVCDLDDSCFVGELSLSGKVRPINGVLPMAIEAKKCGFKKMYIPEGNRNEASAVSGIDIFPVKTVRSLVAHLCGNEAIEPIVPLSYEEVPRTYSTDFAEVKGQQYVKRAVEIAAAGGHNLLLIGAPGSGKSMVAQRIPTIFPDMPWSQSIETTKIHSIAGILPENVRLIKTRPFRSPHHTISDAGLIGGTANLKPGEISLAHNGVLFLDELPEFGKHKIELLRQPLEDRRFTISRASGSVTYPSDIMLIAAMNPCPCGFFGSNRRCTCTEIQRKNYISRISGPLLDRFDMICEVRPVPFEELSSLPSGETSEQIRTRVTSARELQAKRLGGDGRHNSVMKSSEVDKFCKIDKNLKKILSDAFEANGMSARGYNRVLKVARTISDLNGSETITEESLYEALSYRLALSKYWNR